jgi:Leucine-rich repeat (LRR) protein
MSNIFNKLRNKKSEKDSPAADSVDNVSGAKAAFEVSELVKEMQRLGLEPAGLGKFISSLHRLAVVSGVSPENLASAIRDLGALSQDKHLSLAQARRYLQQLAEKQKALTIAIADLERKKGSLEVEMGLEQLDRSTTRESLSEFEEVKQKLESNGLSIVEVSKLISLMESAKELGYDSAAIADSLANLKSQEVARSQLRDEIESLLETRKNAHDRLLALEKEVSQNQQIFRSAEELKRLGFDFSDLEELGSTIRMIAQTRNLDKSDARNQLLSDLQGYYANDQELKKRIRVLESLLEQKEEKFRMLESDYQNERAVLESTRKLISGGVDGEWLGKLRAIMDSYGIDIGMLETELKNREGLKSSIDELARTKKALEEEERLLHQKVVAAEDQRLKTLSLINDLIVNPRSISPQKQPVQDAGASEIGQLRDLVRAANGEIVNNNDFIVSATKAIDIISSKLPRGSPARLVLEHALLALRHEADPGVE